MFDKKLVRQRQLIPLETGIATLNVKMERPEVKIMLGTAPDFTEADANRLRWHVFPRRCGR
jgi:hypothetical protein